ncbi:uncharacterized protein LOC116871499 isoform X1 [Lontra canadensis]|uniref:uncharacterized protein LOC116871499 isoform X1 n=2 Tax=Lontra canadensis TaxID=76717 RepID=UPI0013F37C25|nr:uncharacterized protein LOC116871499 isoform X1 [Lontra canadensis]
MNHAGVKGAALASSGLLGLLRANGNSLTPRPPTFAGLLPQVKLFAPNAEQMYIVNHLKESPAEEKCAGESARRARGDIQDLADLNSSKLEAVIIPVVLGWPRTAPSAVLWRTPLAAFPTCWQLTPSCCEVTVSSLLVGSMMLPGPLLCRSPTVLRAAGRGLLPGHCPQSGSEVAPPREPCVERGSVSSREEPKTMDSTYGRFTFRPGRSEEAPLAQNRYRALSLS